MDVELLRTGTYLFPPVCTCCLTPTEEEKEIACSQQQYSGSMVVTTTSKIGIPLCHECKGHQRAGCLPVILAGLVFIVIQAGWGLLFRRGMEENPESGLSIIGALFPLLLFIVLPVFYIWYRRFRWPGNHPGHARMTIPVKMNVSNEKIRFTFYSEEYGRLFAEANKIFKYK